MPTQSCNLTSQRPGPASHGWWESPACSGQSVATRGFTSARRELSILTSPIGSIPAAKTCGTLIRPPTSRWRSRPMILAPHRLGPPLTRDHDVLESSYLGPFGLPPARPLHWKCERQEGSDDQEGL